MPPLLSQNSPHSHSGWDNGRLGENIVIGSEGGTRPQHQPGNDPQRRATAPI